MSDLNVSSSDNFLNVIFCTGPGGRHFAVFANVNYLHIVVANPDNSNDWGNVNLNIGSTYSALRCCHSYNYAENGFLVVFDTCSR